MDDKCVANYELLIDKYVKMHCNNIMREPNGILKYKFIVPGGGYQDSLWDWDSFFVSKAVEHIVPTKDVIEYEKGCLLNFLECQFEDGRIPVYITPTYSSPVFTKEKLTNCHKPMIAQRAYNISKKINDFSWLKSHTKAIERFISYYEKNCRHESGLFFWIDDSMIGVDNDPCTFYRPKNSSGSILLNCFMYKELLDLAEIFKNLGDKTKGELYFKKAKELKDAIIEHCWDERDGFFYSVDLNLLPIDPNQQLHRGAPRHYSTLIQRIGVWSGFMAMYVGIASKEQAERMVKEHMFNESTFLSNYGIRSLSKMEKMYKIIPSNNPSCWLGPVWCLCNYVAYEGLKNYGYFDLAKNMALRTIKLLGRDLEETGDMHEYYDPETGKHVYDFSFQSWNLFVIKMLKEL